MMCEKAGEVTAQTRSKFLQLGAIFRAYSKVRRYLLYLSKELYNPQHRLLSYYIYGAAQAVLHVLPLILKALIYPALGP